MPNKENSITITIRDILENNIQYPSCLFKKMKLMAQFDAIELEVNERIRQTASELRTED